MTILIDSSSSTSLILPDFSGPVCAPHHQFRCQAHVIEVVHKLIFKKSAKSALNQQDKVPRRCKRAPRTQKPKRSGSGTMPFQRKYCGCRGKESCALYLHTIFFHPGHTVGPGASPGHAPSARELYRRQGIASRTEDLIHFCNTIRLRTSLVKLVCAGDLCGPDCRRLRRRPVR